MTRLVLGVTALFTLGCTGFGVLVYDRDDTTDTTDTDTDSPPTTTPPPDTGVPPEDAAFPARYLGIRAQFAYSRQNNKVMTAFLYGEPYVPKISIELYTSRFLQFGMDYSDTDEYCTIDLLLRSGNPASSPFVASDPTAYMGFAHSGSAAETASTCGDAQHPIDGLFDGDPVQAVLNVSGLPWAEAIGELTTDGGFVYSGSTFGGGRVYNAGALTGQMIADDDFTAQAYAVDPDTGVLLLDEGYNLMEIPAEDMWTGTKLATGLYLLQGAIIVDLGYEY